MKAIVQPTRGRQIGWRKEPDLNGVSQTLASIASILEQDKCMDGYGVCMYVCAVVD